MNLIKILSKIGLVKITKHNYYDQHILDYQLRQPIPPNKPSLVDPRYNHLGGVRTMDDWENWHMGYNRGLPPSRGCVRE